MTICCSPVSSDEPGRKLRILLAQYVEHLLTLLKAKRLVLNRTSWRQAQRGVPNMSHGQTSTVLDVSIGSVPRCVWCEGQYQ